MKKLSNFLIKLLASLAVFCIMTGFLILPAPQMSAAADPVVLTVTGDGVNKTVQFTMADLRALPQETHTYSGYNHWPNLRLFTDCTGPTLQTILDEAGLKSNVTLLRCKPGGGIYIDYTYDQLMTLERYYFPDGTPGDCPVWPQPRSEEGKVRVPAMIALNNASGRLCFGQVATNEPQGGNCAMLEGMCTGGTIYVSCAPLSQWDSPLVNIPSGTVVPAGTLVRLSCPEDTPEDVMIYYTLDGTDPTYGSYIYNISYSNFRPNDVNHPIPINGDVTIKARLIGIGKLDGDVLTLHYSTGEPACTIQGSGLSQPATYTIDTLKSMTPVEGSYQCEQQGQALSVAGKGVLLSTLMDGLNISGLWGVEFVTTGGDKVEAGTVQDLKNQQCMLAYRVNGADVSDVSAGGQTTYIQILRNSSSPADNLLKNINIINLITVPDQITITSVKLLDYAGKPITAVAPGGGYCIDAQLANEMNMPEDALLIFQVRSGDGAAADGGGKVVNSIAAQTVVDAFGYEARAEFTLPNSLSGQAYVDAFIWDNSNNSNPLGKDNHDVSFAIQ
jgi:hypothetical protein